MGITENLKTCDFRVRFGVDTQTKDKDVRVVT